MKAAPADIDASAFLARPGEGSGERVDLHIHTVFSDSLYTPEAVVEQASVLGLRAIAVTDHDSVDGLATTRELCRESGLEFMPGVELSATFRGQEVHLLGYMVDERSESLLRALEMLKGERLKRVRKILKRLSHVGLDIDLDLVLEHAGRGSVGRPHIAAALVEQGIVKSFGEAFRRFLAPGTAAFVPRYRLDLRRAFNIIRGAGGLPILAHPGVLNRDHLIPAMVRLGISGIEVAHPFHKREAVLRYVELARRFRLIPTAGSDCHGPGRGAALGVVTAPYECCELLRRTAAGKDDSGRQD